MWIEWLNMYRNYCDQYLVENVYFFFSNFFWGWGGCNNVLSHIKLTNSLLS